MQIDTIVLWLAIGNSGLIVVLFFLYMSKNSRFHSLNAENQKHEQQLNLFKKHMMQVEEALNELRVGSQGISSNVQKLAREVDELGVQHEKLLNLEPESKLYSQASKMAAQGASVEELMQDCELPRAEAELLLSIHKKTDNPS